MKLLIAFMIMLIAGANSYSQATIKKYRAYQFSLYSVEKSIDFEWQPTNVLVVIDYPRKKVKIYSKITHEYDLLGHEQRFDSKNNGDVLDFDAIDINGDQCELTITKYRTTDSQHTATIVIGYKDWLFVYRLKEN